LLVAGAHYHTVGGLLPAVREIDPAPSDHVLEMVEASARQEALVSGD
jgi:hypothetical protein